MNWIHKLATSSFAAAVFVSGCGALDHTISHSSDPFLSGPESQTAQRPSQTAMQAAKPVDRPSKVIAVSYEEPVEDQVPVGAGNVYGAITRTAAEERIPLACPPEDSELGCQPCLPCLADPGGVATDEYLCDGGDRLYPVHYENGAMAGLHTEDAIAEFNDSNGRRRIQPTNKVCVYSPRFAAVTAYTEPSENITSDYLVSGRNVAISDLVRERKAVVNQRQVVSTDRMISRKRGSELFLPVSRDELHGRDRPAIHDQTLTPVTAFTYIRTGILLKEEEALLATSIQSAVTLTRTEFPIIVAHAAGIGEIKTLFKPNELNGLETPNKPGRLRISKLADKQDARPGDVVTFTIRFDNLGDLPLTEVSIIDNLTPRLEYVTDSATLDRAGALDVQDNGEGSLILTWKLEEPLPGHQGGVISFHAKVR